MYKVGDKVRIKTYNEIGHHACFAEPMRDYCGTVMTIREIIDNDYYMEEDQNDFSGNHFAGWIWLEGWFTPVNEREKITLNKEALFELLGGE